MSTKAITTNTSPASTATTADGYRLPDQTTLQHAVKLSILDDKPILLDYWVGSIDKTVLVGFKESTSEKLLVKSEEEYTSPISKIYRINKDFIIATENSIYIVDKDIPSKRISN